MIEVGRHLIVNVWGCPVDILDNLEEIRNLMIDAVTASGCHIVAEKFHQFEPNGVTGVLILSESHCSYHSWSEHGLGCFDLFTCNPETDLEKAKNIIIERTKAKDYTSGVYRRGRGRE